MTRPSRQIELGNISRRRVLEQAAVLSAAALAAGCKADRIAQSVGLAGRCAVRSHNPIPAENAKLGTRDWMLKSTRIDPVSKYRCPWIEGYCSKTSVGAGEEIEFYVSVETDTEFTIEFFRMGYYGGYGGRLVASHGPFQGRKQPDPEVGPRRIRDCRWDPCLRIRVPDDWVSGVYVGKLHSLKTGIESYVIFIVRDKRPADLLFQCSDTTWQAYNRWPSQFSLYDDGKETWYWGPGVDISFNRPYGKYCQIFDAPLSTGSGEWFLWEYPMAYWLESQGYDVSYISNLDTHGDPAGLLRSPTLLSVGHDEYYSIEMFHQLRAAIGAGLNVGFFSGNTCCGRIEFSSDHAGVANRVFSRTDFYGPLDEAEIKRFPAMAKLPHVSPNANLLIGARSIAPVTGGGPWVCSKPEHWLFQGTGMRQGEGIPGLVGWEWHGDPASIPGLEVVSEGPTENGSSPGHYTATLYPGPKKNFVFNASTCWWADGLEAPPGYVRPSVYTTPQGPDFRAQQITRNFLERTLKARRG